MLSRRRWADQHAGEPNGTARKAHVLTPLDLDALGSSLRRSATLPFQRRYPPRRIAAKGDVGFDRTRDGGTGTESEAIAGHRIQSANVSGFLERDKLILPAEFTPQLEVHGTVVAPPIGALVFAQRGLRDGSGARLRGASGARNNGGEDDIQRAR